MKHDLAQRSREHHLEDSLSTFPAWTWTWSADIILFLSNHIHQVKVKGKKKKPPRLCSDPSTLLFLIPSSSGSQHQISSPPHTLIWSLAGGLWTRGQNAFRFIPANLLPITISAHLPPLPRAGPSKGYSFASLEKKKKSTPIITALQSVSSILATRTIPHSQI